MSTDDPEQTFASSIASLRQERGWSQEQLSERMRNEGVDDATQITVSRIETSRRKVTLTEALALARIFNVPISALADVGVGARLASSLANRQARIDEAIKAFEKAVADYMRDGMRAAQIQKSQAQAALTKLEQSDSPDPETIRRVREFWVDADRILRMFPPSTIASRVETLATRDDGLVKANPTRLTGEQDDGEPEATT